MDLAIKLTTGVDLHLQTGYVLFVFGAISLPLIWTFCFAVLKGYSLFYKQSDTRDVYALVFICLAGKYRNSLMFAFISMLPNLVV